MYIQSLIKILLLALISNDLLREQDELRVFSTGLVLNFKTFFSSTLLKIQNVGSLHSVPEKSSINFTEFSN
jgi:hypothetical protein